jgi:glycosyltransferase involved in cell wall biosynthesis
MKIINAMFGKGLGGIEQAFLDYNKALTMAGAEVLPVIHPKAAIRNQVSPQGAEVSNFGQYDFWAIYKLNKLVKEFKPDCIITHGNRPAMLFSKAAPEANIVYVSHNYNFKRLIGKRPVFAITEHMRQALISAGQSEKLVFRIPNMITLPQDYSPSFRREVPLPVIGAIARLIPKKGLDTFVQALAILQKEGIEFQAIIAGDGPERANIEKRVAELPNPHHVFLLGWIKKKEEFFDKIDIFCLPSRHEPFGIVLLEAMKFGKPIVSTKSEGPLEIISHKKDGLLVEIDDPEDMAQQLKQLLTSQQQREELAHQAFTKLKENYTLEVVGQKLIRILQELH